MNTNKNELGKFIQDIRIKKGLTQEEVEKKAGNQLKRERRK